jgi:pyruvate dehydrogenase E1 component beta subunit
MREDVGRQLDRAVAEACSDPFPEPDSLETLDGPPIRPPAPAVQTAEEAVELATSAEATDLLNAIVEEYQPQGKVKRFDLVLAGTRGLRKASTTWDESTGESFIEYAESFVREPIAEMVRVDVEWRAEQSRRDKARHRGEDPDYKPEPELARTLSWGQAIAEAVREEMDRDERVFLIGEDLGPVREREDLWEQLRERRVFQTPISEATFVGLGTGAAATGLRPIVEIMYMDFVAVCFDQIVNQCAPLKLMSGGRIDVPMVIKTPAGCGTREAAHHSGHHEAWFMHAPGLKVVLPSNGYDAKGLLKTAIRDDHPVLFVEHRLLRRAEFELPEGEWTVPFGEAAVRREGDDITVVATSYAVRRVMQAAHALEGEIGVEVIDPRTLVPLDVDTIIDSVAKTGRLLVVHEAPARAGAGAEILRRVMEDGGFELLEAAPKVLARADTPMPYSPPLEDAVLPQTTDIAAAIREMVWE